MKGLKTARPRFGAGEREKGKPVEAEEAVAATERWKRSLEDGPRRRCTRQGRGSGEAGASETKSAKKERKPRGGDGGWVVFEKELPGTKVKDRLGKRDR
ncbi:hypothetical protein K0M31_009948 [Melipona bicolor]|uniref:Uncharacterized protein n=1 Tax=Melipona bicolor TaxID=60889 RepID=A0AA40FND8_9HYME|nr:hypothetical protein K0M31_009948 [Melipona bicolor]